MKSPSKVQTALLYLFAFFQGISFSLIPGAANFLMGQDGFGFSQYEYGNLFIMMIFGALFSSFFGTRIFKPKSLLAVSLILNTLAMALFFLEHLLIGDLCLSYPFFLILMLLLGGGFGAALSSLNYFAFQFFPKKQSIALTALHSFLGVGAALGPLHFIFFLGLGLWPVAPFSLSIIFLLLFLGSLLFFEKDKKIVKKKQKRSFLPLVLFSVIALLYGFMETTFGNWGSVLLYKAKDLSLSEAGFALSLFWASITFFRIVITFLMVKVKPKRVYITLAPIILLSLILLHFSEGTVENLLVFILAGLGCSGILPLTFSFAQKSVTGDTENASGYISGLYMAGYGCASWGIGALLKSGSISLSEVFIQVMLVASALIILTGYLYRKKA